MIAARIARRLVRKLAKPFLLWLTEAKQDVAEHEADRYMLMRADLVGMELDMRRRSIVLAERRNRIRNW